MKSQNPNASLEELSKMEADYRQLLQQQNELDGTDPDLLAEMNEGWSNGYGLDMEGLDNDFGMNKLDDRPRYDENGVPSIEQYSFGRFDSLLFQNPLLTILTRANHIHNRTRESTSKRSSRRSSRSGKTSLGNQWISGRCCSPL